MVVRSRGILSPVVGVCVFHGGVGIGDIIPSAWRGRWRRRHGHRLGVEASGFGCSGRLESLVGVSDGGL